MASFRLQASPSPWQGISEAMWLAVSPMRSESPAATKSPRRIRISLCARQQRLHHQQPIAAMRAPWKGNDRLGGECLILGGGVKPCRRLVLGCDDDAQSVRSFVPRSLLGDAKQLHADAFPAELREGREHIDVP